MPNAKFPLPVFMPGNSRNWKEIQGVAEISPEGIITVTLHPPQAGLELASMTGLVALSFDYKDPTVQKEQT